MKQWKRTGMVQTFCNWAQNEFNRGRVQELCTQYNTYQRGGYSSSRPAGAISFGVGGGYGGYGRRGWW